MDSLPIDSLIPRLLEALDRDGRLVLTAPTGAGKTTRVPPAILDHRGTSSGQILVLQPRRVAARSTAARIAAERGSRPGNEIGYRVRFDDCTSASTRLIVMTEGILLRMLQENPLLEGISAVIFDEFHERNLDSDLALAMVRRIRDSVRPDLWMVVMSATLEPGPVSDYLAGCETIGIAGKSFPVDIEFLKRPDRRPLQELVVSGIEKLWSRTAGDVLVFLPGQREIRQAEKALDRFARRESARVLLLYGDLPAHRQDEVLQPHSERRIILATNVAETSLTIPGITAVVDSGLERCPRFDPAVGLDRLQLEPISQASADQRSGRAGRTAPGICLRLWDRTSHQRRARAQTPEIQRVDLASTVLQLKTWGESQVRDFPWFESPADAQIERAEEQLEHLGALTEGRVAELGRSLVRMPVHPRLARLMVAGHSLRIPGLACLAAAVLSERSPFHRTKPVSGKRTHSPLTTETRSDSDLVDQCRDLMEFDRTGRTAFARGELNRGSARYLFKIRDQLLRILEMEFGTEDDERQSCEERLMQAALAAYPDRLARRRATGERRAVMAGGRGVRIGRSCAVQSAELFVCLEVDAGQSEAVVSMASGVDSDWLDPGRFETRDECFFHPSQRRVVNKRLLSWNGLVLEERDSPVRDLDQARRLLGEAALRNWSHAFPEDDSETLQLLERIRWLAGLCSPKNWPNLDKQGLCDLAVLFLPDATSLENWKRADWKQMILDALSWEQRAFLDRAAPEKIEVPGGSRIRLQYRSDGPPILAVRIQQVFGWDQTPRVGEGRVAVLLHLLAPNQRPQQITDDLASFWVNTYPQVRRDLRARYPKHAWPENPVRPDRT